MAINGKEPLKTKVSSKRHTYNPIIEVTTLGAARNNGKSCILVNIMKRLVMLDCGIDPSFQPSVSSKSKYFPNFSKIRDIDKISCVIISHCHIDHVGALPFFTEILGFSGPIYMTHATKKLSEVVLEESIKQLNMSLDTTQNKNIRPLTMEDIVNCLEKVTTVNYKESFTNPFDNQVVFTLFPAGHVLGASLVLIATHYKTSEQTVLYTGDFNNVQDRINGKIELPIHFPGVIKTSLDVLITETTFSNTIRNSRLNGDAKLFETLHNCFNKTNFSSTISKIFMQEETVEQNNKTKCKLLIPCSSFGRLQEYLILLNEFIEINNLKVPIYFSSKLAEKYNQSLSIFPRYSIQLRQRNSNNIKESRTYEHNNTKNNFNFLDFNKLKHVKVWPYKYNETVEAISKLTGGFIFLCPSPDLEHGLSRIVFKEICQNANNVVLFPGKCPAGTIGFKLINTPKNIDCSLKLDGNTYKVKSSTIVLESFSNHTDAKGILDLIEVFKPLSVILVHGNEDNMLKFAKTIEEKHPLSKVYCPKLNETKAF